MKKYRYNCSLFESVNTEAEAYWLGFLIADGCNLGKFIRIDIKDEGHLEKLRDFIFTDKDKPIKIRDLGFGPVYYLSMNNEKLVRNLNAQGLVPNKSKIVQFPKIPEVLYHHFIRGVFDGDGSLNYSEELSVPSRYKRYTFSIVGAGDLISRINQILNDTGLRCIKRKHKMIFETYCRGNRQILEVMKYLYKDATIYLDRKYGKYKEFENYCLTRQVRNKTFLFN
jgi:hypothetical protein